MTTETNERYFTVHLLQRTLQRKDRVSDFIIYFNIFGEFDNFADWDEAHEAIINTIINIIVLIIDLIFINFVSDHVIRKG